MRDVEEENIALEDNIHTLRRLDEGTTKADGERAVALAKDSIGILFKPEAVPGATDQDLARDEAARIMLSEARKIIVQGTDEHRDVVAKHVQGEEPEPTTTENAKRLQSLFDGGVNYFDAQSAASEMARVEATKIEAENYLLGLAWTDIRSEKAEKTQVIRERQRELAETRDRINDFKSARNLNFEETPVFAKIKDVAYPKKE